MCFHKVAIVIYTQPCGLLFNGTLSSCEHLHITHIIMIIICHNTIVILMSLIF